MLFDDRKFDAAQLAEMFSCPISTIEPYSLLLAPAYVYMKRNERVVSVKGPLDFFTPDELERIRGYEMIYFPKFVKSSVQFQTSARLVRKILSGLSGSHNSWLKTAAKKGSIRKSQNQSPATA